MNKEKILNELLDNLVVPEGMTKDAAWEKLNARMQTQPVESIVLPMWKKWLPTAVSIAASLVLILWFGLRDQETVISSIGEKIEHVLPDGSVVSLNRGSEIAYNEDTWANDRSLMLDGEAFFEVKKGSTFTVRSSSGDVSVMGTSFNIFTREGFYEVDCYSGKVKVASNEKNILLTKGLSTKLQDGNLVSEYENSLSNPDWKTDSFHFEGMELNRVFIEIENEFDVEIEYNNVNNDEVLEAGGSHKIISLAHSLDVVCQSLGLTYEIDGKNILIKK